MVLSLFCMQITQHPLKTMLNFSCSVIILLDREFYKRLFLINLSKDVSFSPSVGVFLMSLIITSVPTKKTVLLKVEGFCSVSRQWTPYNFPRDTRITFSFTVPFMTLTVGIWSVTWNTTFMAHQTEFIVLFQLIFELIVFLLHRIMFAIRTAPEQVSFSFLSWQLNSHLK